MRLLFCGTPETAIPALEEIEASPHEIVAVLTRPDARTGRGRTLRPSPVKARALELGLEVMTPESLTEPKFYEALNELEIDCAPVVAYGALIPEKFLTVPTYGWINLHFSLLPAWRGAAPVQHAIWHGDEFTGATTFLIEKGLDTGPTFGTVTERITPQDTAANLLERLSHSGAQLLLATLDAIASGQAHAQPQPADGTSHAGKITVNDAQIDWTQPALAISRHIRACTPAPGAWTDIATHGPTTDMRSRVKIGPITLDTTTATENQPPLSPGQFDVGKRAIRVGTGSHPILLDRVSPAGKSWMPAADWARGAHLSPDACFVRRTETHKENS